MNFGQIKVWFKDIINLLDKYILIGASSLIVFCVWQTQNGISKIAPGQNTCNVNMISLPLIKCLMKCLLLLHVLCVRFHMNKNNSIEYG